MNTVTAFATFSGLALASLLFGLFIFNSAFITLSLMLLAFGIIFSITTSKSICFAFSAVIYAAWKFFIHTIKNKSATKKYQPLVDEALKIEVASNSRRAESVLERIK